MGGAVKDAPVAVALAVPLVLAAIAVVYQHGELERLRARPADTVVVEVPRVDELPTWQISCRWVPRDSSALTTADP